VTDPDWPSQSDLAEDAPEMLRNVFAMSLLAGHFMFVAGCGGGPADAPKTVPAKGTVTVDGKGIAKLAVVFMPDHGKIATGETDSEGHFTLTTNTSGDGAVVGTYKVAVTPIVEVSPLQPGMDGYVKPAPPPYNKKYLEHAKSGLTLTVDSDPAKNDFKLELSAK